MLLESPTSGGGGSGNGGCMPAVTAIDLLSPSTVCSLCGENYQQPKVLACFHTFCKLCLEKLVDSPKRIICPTCQAETQLCADQGVDSLLSDYAAANLIEEQQKRIQIQNQIGSANGGDGGDSKSPSGESAATSDDGDVDDSAEPVVVTSLSTGQQQPSCTGCKSKDSSAVAHCYDCTNFLCANCVMAHQFMHCFEGHRVVDLTDCDAKSLNVRPVKCLQHKQETLKYFCFACNIPVCKECTVVDHPRSQHQYENIADVSTSQLEYMQRLLDEARNKQKSLVQVFKGVDSTGQRLSASFDKAQMIVAETAHVLQQLVEEQRQQALRDLENAYTSKQAALNLIDRKLQQTMEKLSHTIDFTSRLLQFAAPTEVMVFKKLLENRLHAILNYNPDLSLVSHYELEFVPNIQAARLAISNTYGYVRQSQDLPLVNKNPVQPISRPALSGSLPSNGASPPNPPSTTGGSSVSPLSSSLPHQSAVPSVLTTQFSPGLLINGVGGAGHGLGPAAPAVHAFSDSNLLQSKQFGGSSQSLGPFSSLSDTYNYEKWSSGGSDFASSFYGSGETPVYFSSPTLPDQLGGSSGHQQVVDLTSKLSGGNSGSIVNGGGSSSLFPPKSQIKRHKMIYHCKFGEFGVMEGQFTEPSGVAVNAQNDIIVADTNNHRIQIFDKEGRFKFQFGECGKRDGQLLYPNRVAVNRSTGDIVVTERSPTHQIQVYNQYGQFLRKFGANILQHPRGVTVDAKGRIVVVECKVMRVIIFDLMGNVLQKFGCSKYLEFPNGVVTNDKQEIFISDNRAHCVKVFNYDGAYVRQIGGEGLTNYPIGVGVNHVGEVVVADNHNNFNLTVFQQDGTLVNALESKVKHAQCFDVALLDDGSVVLASKDYRLYIYRYLQVPPLPM